MKHGADDDAGYDEQPRDRTRGHHDDRGTGARARDGPAGAEDDRAEHRVPRQRRPDQAKLSTERRAPSEPVQQEERWRGHANGGRHEEEDVQFLEQQHAMDDVVLVQLGAREDESEDETHAERYGVHSAPPVTKWSVSVIRTATAMKVQVATMLVTEREAVPDIP